jgi:hypothetical protein
VGLKQEMLGIDGDFQMLVLRLTGESTTSIVTDDLSIIKNSEIVSTGNRVLFKETNSMSRLILL